MIPKSDKTLEEFKVWLVDNGATVEESKSQWEVVRYKLPEFGLCIGYRNQRGDWNLVNPVNRHFNLFLHGKPLKKPKRFKKAGARKNLINKLKERDGFGCCLCGQFLNDDITLEHWFCVAYGGTHHDANFGLAHNFCNTLLGNLSISEKIALREKAHKIVEMFPPWEYVSFNDKDIRALLKEI